MRLASEMPASCTRHCCAVVLGSPHIDPKPLFVHSQTLPLLWSHVESESEEAWLGLFETFIHHFGDSLMTKPLGFMSGM